MKRFRNGILIIFLIITAVQSGCIFRKPLTEDKTEESSLPEVTEPVTTEDPADTGAFGVRAALKSHEVYRLDDLSFTFVIAVFDIHAPAGETITLDHFHTDEGIYLDRIQEYETELEEHSYYPGRKNVMFSLVSAKEDYEAALLIPVADKAKKSLTLICDLEGIEDFTIDLEKNIITDGSSLYAEKGKTEVISDDETYSLIVNDALEITDELFYMTDGEGNRIDYTIPSAVRVYAFEIEARRLGDDSVVISDALFIPEGYEEGYHAMNGAIRSMKESNMIGRSIQKEDRGFLFFEVYGPEYSPVTYNGVLYLFLEGKDEPLSIQVNLN